tara:strand:+ start:137 stop:394 length:258 start_codon:yes stop_codon:yes gene_type:complete
LEKKRKTNVEGKFYMERNVELVVINISILIIITTPLYVTPLAVVYIPKRKNKISPFLHTKDGTTSGTSKAAFRGADLARFGSFAF